MPRHARLDHDPVRHVERREQRRRAVALVVVRHRPRAARIDRQAFLRAVQGLNLALLVDAQHDRVLRRVEVQPTTSTSFSANCGSLESLKVLTRCGCRPLAFHTRCTIDGDVPSSAASVRVLQCVAAGGFSVVVLRTISAASRAVLAGRPPRGASFSMPARPCLAKRPRHWQTVFIPVFNSAAMSCSICPRQPRARFWPGTPSGRASFGRAPRCNVRRSSSETAMAGAIRMASSSGCHLRRTSRQISSQIRESLH